MEKEMATHSSILAWEIPWTEEPGGLQSISSQWVGHDWANRTHISALKHLLSLMYEMIVLSVSQYILGIKYFDVDFVD